jgi:hypothetical protein
MLAKTVSHPTFAVVPFLAQAGEAHLVVGMAANTFLSPRSCSSDFLQTMGRDLNYVTRCVAIPFI